MHEIGPCPNYQLLRVLALVFASNNLSRQYLDNNLSRQYLDNNFPRQYLDNNLSRQYFDNKGGRMMKGQQLVARAWLDKDFKTRQRNEDPYRDFCQPIRGHLVIYEDLCQLIRGHIW